MLIENVDALKQWLVQKLSPICDAEPTALAKYVCALVRKEKTEAELKEICNDQLDVFLQQKTRPFVDELFEGLKTKEYEKQATKSSIPTISSTPTQTPSSTPAATPTPTPIKAEVVVKTESTSPAVVLSQSASASSSQSKLSSSDSNTRRSKKLEDASQAWQPPPIKQEPLDIKDSRDGRDARDNRERDTRDDRERRDGRENDRRDNDRRESRDTRDARDRRRRTRSRSLSPRRGREMDERRRRYDDRDRNRYSPERRYSPDRRYRRRSRSRSPRRYRPSPERQRGRSRSPRERDLREKLNRRSRSWSRPRSRSRSRSRGRVEPDSRGSTPTQDNGHYPAVVTSNTSLPSLVTVAQKPSEPPPPGEGPPLVIPGPGGHQGPPPSAGPARIRCLNFDEKGFCMLGDLCPYDHGMDPVVVEDIGIPNVLSFPPPPPGHPLPPPVPGNMSVPPPRPGFLPPGMAIPPPGAIALRPHLAPRPPTAVEPYQPEGYNPEAPAITRPIVRQPLWAGPPPRGGPLPSFPQPGSRNTPPMQRRDLVTVPRQEETEDSAGRESEPPPPDMTSRVVIPAKRTRTEMEGPMEMGRVVQRSFVNPRFTPQARNIRKPFDFNRLGGGSSRQQFRHENTTLEVRKIPVEFNTIAKLDGHFGKFGNLTNIQVKFSGDPCAALISFSRNDEAARAYHSSEPVFNNRFIKLFWHRPAQTAPADASNSSDQSHVSPAGTGIAARLGPVNQPPVEASPAEGVGVESSSEADSSTSPESLTRLPISSRLGLIPPSHKLSLNNLTKQASQGNIPTEKSIVYTSSMGNLKKTVFNQGMSKARATVAARTSPSAVRPADFVTRIEAIKKSEEMKKEAIVRKAELDKQKQVLLEKQISQQKLLLDRLEKGKATLTLEEKTNLMKMLKVVSDSIDKLKFSSPSGPKKLAPTGSLRLVNTPPTTAASAAAPVTIATRRLSSGSSPASVQQTKKDILDTELDLMTKQGAGEDTTPLRRRLVELTQQAASMGLLGRGRGAGRGRGGSPWMQGRGRGGTGSMSLDNRPKTLEVRGFDLDEVDELKIHFGTFGEIVKTDIKEDIPCALMTFSNRKQAELAYTGGSKFKKKLLSLRWHLGIVRMISVESEPATEDPDDEDDESAADTEEAHVTVGSEADLEEQLLLATEEEEEEDQESRAWRR